MKKTNLGMTAFLAVTLFLGVYCLGAAPQKDQPSNNRLAALNAHDEDSDLERWDDEAWEDEEHDDDYDEEHDEGDEFQWELAEQALFQKNIEIASSVAKDEVKTVVVTATLLLEHAELSTTIKTLSKASEGSNSPAVKRALLLKLAEAHLENDDPTAAVAIANQLLTSS